MVKTTEDPLRVLVVDDEQDIRDGSERILSRMGFEVLKASRGEEGLETIATTEISIVFLDLKMPGIDGLEVLARIREMNRKIMVIVITGFATVETAIEAMKRGAYDFIPKPFEPDQMRIVANRAREKLLLTREAELLEQERIKTLAHLDTEKSRISTIIKSLPNGVAVTNANGEVVLTNPAFRRQLGLPSDKTAGGHISAYIDDKDLCQLITDISRGKFIDYEEIPDYEVNLADGKFLRARSQPVVGDRHECLGAVVIFENITALKAMDRLKSEFVAKVSHELRSPLSTIHEQLALVLKDAVEGKDADDQHLLSRAKEKTQSLIALIGDLLDLSRIEAGSVSLEPKPLQIETSIKGIVEFLMTRANTKDQKLLLVGPKEPLQPIVADPMAIESIFGNLISNAITYTPEGGEIRVSIESAGPNIRVEVKDTGFGIDAKYLNKIFEKFYRVKDENTRYITGTGLGLPIVKGLVDSMGGIISVESIPGEGSCFTVLLPV